jgi:hypothetical protein
LGLFDEKNQAEKLVTLKFCRRATYLLTYPFSFNFRYKQKIFIFADRLHCTKIATVKNTSNRICDKAVMTKHSHINKAVVTVKMSDHISTLVN